MLSYTQDILVLTFIVKKKNLNQIPLIPNHTSQYPSMLNTTKITMDHLEKL